VDKEQFAEFVAHHKKRGHLSFAAAPLLSGNNVMGNLLIFSTQPSAATASQLGFLQTLAQQAMVALRMNDLVDEARQSAISQERNLMAREIHDTLAQNFVGVLMQMEAAEEAKSLAPDQVAAFHDRVRLLAKEGILQARKAVYTFGQPSDDRTPIDESTRQILHRFCDGTRIKYEVTTEGEVSRITPTQNAQLRSILVEAIVNAVKHGSPESLRVNFNCGGQPWQVSVIDDGCGMAMAQQENRGIANDESESKALSNGLSNIRTRVQSIGGELHIESSPGLGTTIRIIGPKL
jgi:signal transduction histidine kinase